MKLGHSQRPTDIGEWLFRIIGDVAKVYCIRPRKEGLVLHDLSGFRQAGEVLINLIFGDVHRVSVDQLKLFLLTYTELAVQGTQFSMGGRLVKANDK